MAEPVVVATWKFGEVAARAAVEQLRAGKPALDAALAGAQAVEDDTKVNSVGFGGLPNALGTVQLDACVMDGKTLDCGAVAAVENVRHVAALARRVMEKTPHVLIVGEGAGKACLAVCGAGHLGLEGLARAEGNDLGRAVHGRLSGDSEHG